MSATSLERRTGAVRSVGPTRTRQLRPGWGAGRGTRPISRSLSGVSAPTVDHRYPPHPVVRSCSPALDRTRAEPPDGWRLTNLGIAVILIVGALLAVAAITVITTTAIRVTSDGYHPQDPAVAQR